jgi:hypothetical protein
VPFHAGRVKAGVAVALRVNDEELVVFVVLVNVRGRGNVALIPSVSCTYARDLHSGRGKHPPIFHVSSELSTATSMFLSFFGVTAEMFIVE